MKKILIIALLFFSSCEETLSDSQELSKANYPIKVINSSIDGFGERRYLLLDSSGKCFEIWSGYENPYKIGQIINNP